MKPAIFYRVDKAFPNVLIAVKVNGYISYKVFHSNTPITEATYSKDECTLLQDTPIELCHAIGLLYKRIVHLEAGTCTLESVLVNDVQFITFMKYID